MATWTMRRAMHNMPVQEFTEKVISNMAVTKNNKEFLVRLEKIKGDM